VHNISVVSDVREFQAIVNQNKYKFRGDRYKFLPNFTLHKKSIGFFGVIMRSAAGEVMGFAAADVYQSGKTVMAKAHCLGVTPGYRRTGAATSIMDNLAAQCMDRSDAVSIFALCNPISAEVLEKLGWARKTDGFITRGGYRACIRMERSLK
jgi:N-acetylglutamate synthase-like GNAT family acetyltransferase